MVEIFLLLALEFAHADCALTSVRWPENVNRSCRLETGLSVAQTGKKATVTDVAHPGSRALFYCNPYEWIFLSGTCTISHNYVCIGEWLREYADRYDIPLYRRISDSPRKINEALHDVAFPGRMLLVDFTNDCDQKIQQ